MEWNLIEPKVVALQDDIVNTMSEIERLSELDKKFPDIPASFSTSKTMVENPEFNVVVCGEVKKGKSSLLNAIIGTDYLPVNNEIATSQVFRISNSTSESFYLVFTDGTRQEISKEELTKYGSQVDHNLNGEPIFKNRKLSYIQVNVPIAFLPKGVNLVDTPGLGALYKSHEWITQSYVKNASAVIFVIDPERPIVDKEKEFINKVLSVTPHILFVLTKIDQYSEEKCQEIISRDEELLALIYAEHNFDAPEIYPISSKALNKASSSKIEALKNANLKNSKFPEVKNQLMLMIYRAIGLMRTGVALRELADQTSKAKKIIDEILQVTAQDNPQAQMRLNQEKEARAKELSQTFNEESAKSKEYVSEIRDICNSLSSRVQQIVMSSGTIYKEYEAKIDALTDLDSARKLGETLPQEVTNDVIAQWENIALEAQDKVIAVLGEVGAEMDHITYGLGGDVDSHKLQLAELSMKDKIQCYRNQYFTGTWVSGIGAGILAGLGVISFPIVAPIAAVLGAVWCFFTGGDDSKEKALNKTKANFRAELSKLLSELGVKLLQVGRNSNQSVVADYAKNLCKMGESAIANMLAERKAILQKQLQDLQAQASLDAEERKKTEAAWLGYKKDCDNIILQIKKEVGMRNEIASLLKIG